MFPTNLLLSILIKIIENEDPKTFITWPTMVETLMQHACFQDYQELKYIAMSILFQIKPKMITLSLMKLYPNFETAVTIGDICSPSEKLNVDFITSPSLQINYFKLNWLIMNHGNDETKEFYELFTTLYSQYLQYYYENITRGFIKNKFIIVQRKDNGIKPENIKKMNIGSNPVRYDIIDGSILTLQPKINDILNNNSKKYEKVVYNIHKTTLFDVKSEILMINQYSEHILVQDFVQNSMVEKECSKKNATKNIKFMSKYFILNSEYPDDANIDTILKTFNTIQNYLKVREYDFVVDKVYPISTYVNNESNFTILSDLFECSGNAENDFKNLKSFSIKNVKTRSRRTNKSKNIQDDVNADEEKPAAKKPESEPEQPESEPEQPESEPESEPEQLPFKRPASKRLAAKKLTAKKPAAKKPAAKKPYIKSKQDNEEDSKPNKPMSESESESESEFEDCHNESNIDTDGSNY